jgi:CRISPR system Cascade subunit CasA
MDNMKARCWYDSTIPLYHLPPESRKLFQDNVGKLVLAATEVASNLRGALRKAWFRRPQDKGGDTSFITAAFWQSTESSFYGALADIHAKLTGSADLMDARRAWLRYLNDASLALFDQWALGGPIEDSDPRRIALARHELRKFNHSSRLLNELGLPTQRQQKPAAVPQGELA